MPLRPTHPHRNAPPLCRYAPHPILLRPALLCRCAPLLTPLRPTLTTAPLITEEHESSHVDHPQRPASRACNRPVTGAAIVTSQSRNESWLSRCAEFFTPLFFPTSKNHSRFWKSTRVAVEMNERFKRGTKNDRFAYQSTHGNLNKRMSVAKRRFHTRI